MGENDERRVRVGVNYRGIRDRDDLDSPYRVLMDTEPCDLPILLRANTADLSEDMRQDRAMGYEYIVREEPDIAAGHIGEVVHKAE